MAKLSGTADPTIVKMAYAEALGNVPLDQSENYQKIVEAHAGFMEDIKTQAKNYKAMQAIDELAFETAMSVFDNPLAAQVIDSDYNMMYTEVEAQRKAWEDSKGFKDNDKGLADWNRKNQQIIQRYQGNQQDLIDLKTGVDGKVYDIKSMPKSDLNFMTNIANYQANKNNKSGIYNEKATEYMKNNSEATMEDMWNSLGVKEEGAVVKYHDPATGEYTYVSKVTNKYGEEMIVSSKSSDLKSKFDKYKKADDSLLEAEKLYERVHKNALNTTKGWSTFKGQYMNDLEKIIDNGAETNENTLGYLMNKKIGGQEKTFADALRDGDVSSAEIINSLSLDNDGYKGDVNKDGKLDKGDFTSVENYQKVVDAILNGELDKTSPGTTKEMYLDYMDTQFEKEHDLRKKVEKPKRGNYVVDGQQYSPETFDQNWGPHVDILNSGTTGKTDGEWNAPEAPNGTLYRGSDEEGWELFDGERWQPATKSQVAASIDLNMSHGLNFQVTSSAQQEANTEEEARPEIQVNRTYKPVSPSGSTDINKYGYSDMGTNAYDDFERQTQADKGESWWMMDDDEAAGALNGAFNHLGLEFRYNPDAKDYVLVYDTKTNKSLGRLETDYYGVESGSGRKAEKQLKKILSERYAELAK